MMLLIHYSLKETGAVLEDNKIAMAGISFQIKGYENAKGYVSLREMASCRAELFIFRVFPEEFNGAEFMAKVMKYYNMKLNKTLYFMKKHEMDY